MTEEKTTVVDSTRQTFEQHLADYAQAEADLQAATVRREAARLAVMRSRPTGVTSVEVARQLKAAATAHHTAPQPAAPRSR
jgi:hypothetical protein